ncbi:MAG: hypothetical protein ACOCV2_11460 [Persicimonas sp.]
MPGFWVPPRHLEANPYVHIRARLDKFERGLAELETRPSYGAVEVTQNDAAAGLDGLADRGVEADLIFFDPPYGDSVPFVEFSKLWNSFLDEDPRASIDLSVSDRETDGGDWDDYRRGLAEVVNAARRVLADDGKLLITFNNHDFRAWSALLGALQEAGFGCDRVTYQIPAVISSKAQFSPKKSYQGDLYAVFSTRSADWAPRESLDEVFEAARACASSRGGRVAYNLALRSVAIAWLRGDVTHERLDERDRLIDEWFEPADESGFLSWRGDLLDDVERIDKLVERAATDALEDGSLEWPELYRRIADQTAHLGPPDPAEVRQILSERVEFDERTCRLREGGHGAQESLFGE